MPKVLKLTNQDGSHGGWLAECPACGFGHLFDPRWKFNGDVERPTFEPSMLVHANPRSGPPSVRCHSFLRDGVWEYLGDCQHEMAGQRVPVPELSG